MRQASLDGFIESLFDYQLLDPLELAELVPLLSPDFRNPESFGMELVSRGLLTPYQHEEMMAGRGRELILGPYAILGHVGEGGMGQVWLARHRISMEIVALKVIRKHHRADAKLRQRFLREVQALTRLAHPNIIRALDANEAASAHYFAMEYVEGTSLSQIILQQGPIPLAPACDYIRQAALGLQHAHENGLVHRDVSPSNLLVQAWRAAYPETAGANIPAEMRDRFGRWGTVKLFDLGLVLLQHHELSPEEQSKLTKTGFTLGTVDYIAPEQVTDAHRVDIRADLYSLGCVFYEMLSGQVPFPDPSPARRLVRHQTDEPEPIERLRPDLPAEVAEVVRKLMAKQPAERYPTPKECAEVLTEVMLRLDNLSFLHDWTPFDDSRHAPVSRNDADTPVDGGRWWQRILPWGRPGT